MDLVSAANEKPQDLKGVQLLFVQNAKDVAMKDGRLPLTMFCDLSAEPPGIRTACNETEEPR